MEKLTANERLTLWAVATGTPTIKRIAERVNVTTRTVNYIIKRLKERGLIKGAENTSQREITPKGQAALNGF